LQDSEEDQRRIIATALDGQLKSFCKKVEGEKSQQRVSFANMRCPEKGLETREWFFRNIVAIDIDTDPGKSPVYLMIIALRLEDVLPPETTHKTHSVSCAHPAAKHTKCK